VLLDHGEKGAVNAMCSLGVTPLHLAAQYNRLDVAKLLIKRGADVDARAGVDGATALYYAVGYGFLEMTRLLLQTGSDSLAQRQGRNGFPLMYAAITGQYECLQIMLDGYADTSARRLAVNRRDGIDGVSILEGVVAGLQQGRGEEERLLLNLAAVVKAGADVTAMSSRAHGSQTPLHMAARIGRIKPVRIILRGATEAMNISLPSFIDQPSGEEGCTALHYACSSASKSEGSTSNSKTIERIKLVELLVKAGGNVNSRIVAHSDAHADSSRIHGSGGVSSKMLGATPLYIAAASSSAVSAALIQVLLAGGADPNIALDDSAGGYTPLLAAIDHHNQDAVEALLLLPPRPASSNGIAADPNKGSVLSMSSSQSPLLMAVVKSQARSVALLLQAGAECHVAIATAADQKPMSLIGFAKARRDYDVLQALTAHQSCLEADEDETIIESSAPASTNDNKLM
jgi:ankyrin repeat protein